MTTVSPIALSIATKSNHTSTNVGKHRKDKGFDKQYTVVTRDLKSIIELRLYHSPSVTNACIWLHDSFSNTHVSGGGKATGYGYHRASEATARAIEAAGITLSYDIGGHGDTAIRGALEVIAAYLGYLEVAIFEAHA